MGEYTPEGFGERLRKAMVRRGWSYTGDVRRLQKEVHKATKGARGTSYASVYGYVHGNAPPSEPRREVVAALATVLGVLPEHLLFGGPRTLEEGALRVPPEVTREEQQRQQRLRIAVYDAVKIETGALLPVGVDVGVVEVLMTAISRKAYGTPGEEPDGVRYMKAASALGRALGGPLHALEIDPADWPEPVKAQYVIHALTNLLVPLDLAYGRAVDEWSAKREAASRRSRTNRRRQ